MNNSTCRGKSKQTNQTSPTNDEIGDDRFIESAESAGHPLSTPTRIQRLTNFLNVVLDHGGITELRILGADRQPKGISVGWFDAEHRESLAKIAIAESARANGAYFCPNEIRTDLLERSPNKIRSSDKKKFKLTEDSDITVRHWFVIDIDPIRPADVSSTAEEKFAAGMLCDDIRDYLAGEGWPAATFIIDSGNGYHLYYRMADSDPFSDQYEIVLPTGENYSKENDPAKLVLKHLAEKFNNSSVNVDTSVYNPSRIFKLPYTWVRKGANSKERPHRIASILGDNLNEKLVTREMMMRLASRAKNADKSPKTSSANRPQNSAKSSGDPGQISILGQTFSDEVIDEEKFREPGFGASRPDNVRRAIAYLQKVEPAISGQGGHSQTLRAARAVVYEFNLGVEKGLEILLQHYNPRCQPPWDESDLRHKCEEADRDDYSKPRGGLIEQDSQRFKAKQGSSSGGSGAGTNSGSGASPLSPSGPERLATPHDAVLRKQTDPVRLANHFIDTRKLINSPVVYWRGEWFEYRPDRLHYQRLDTDQLKSYLCRSIDALFVSDALLASTDERQAEVTPKSLTMISNTIETLKSLPGIMVSAEFDPPTVIDNPNLIDLERCFVTKSCVIDLHELVNGREAYVTPRDASAFILGGSAADCNPEQTSCDHWFRFLDEIFESDQSRIARLQEWFGYCLTNDTDLHKILFLIGPPRSGKGTITHILQEIVGGPNCTSFQIGKLDGRFALEPFVGRTLAICPECRIDRNTATPEVLANLLQISGQDEVQIDRKGRPVISMRLRTRLVIGSNEMPMFRDASAALASRALPLYTQQSFEGREDRDLRKKLQTELSGILDWAIHGWKRLKESRKFTETIDDSAVRQEIRNNANSVVAFVDDCCSFDDDAKTPLDDLFEAYQKWAKKNGEGDISKRLFSKNLYAGFPDLGKAIRVGSGSSEEGKIRVVPGIRVRIDNPYS